MKYQQTINAVYSRLDRLGDLPIFSATVNRIQQISSSQESDAMALAMAVMKDANLSIKLLKLANTPGYNRGQGPIKVVSRAVVLLGFDRIKSLTVTLKLIETLGQNRPEADIGSLQMRAFLSGALARELAQRCGVRDVEQTYLCGLLHNLGETALAYTQPDLYKKMLQLRQGSGESWEALQLRVLGGNFSDIGQDLATSWGFPKAMVLTMDALTAEQLRGDDRLGYHLVSLSSQLLELLHAKGTHGGPGYAQLLKDISSETGIDRDAIEQSISHAYKLVCDLALEYEVPPRPLVPPLDSTDPDVAELNRRTAYYIHSRLEAHDTPPSPEQPAPAEIQRTVDSGQSLQLDYLQALSELLSASAPPQEVLQKVIEAIIKSTGCDRAALCLLDRDGQQLAVRIIGGESQAPLRDYLKFNRGQGEGDFFFRLLGQGSSLFVSDIDQDDWRRRLPSAFVAAVLPQGFVLSPLQVGSRTIGFLYADRLRGHGAVSEDDFRGFNRFFLQARLAFSHAGAKGKRAS
ncbi:HDOD domain-containing protein [Marinobacterium rhizophilum]|uniref:HDOD domain-containing protein n=1 Tax=Marinobacterium rhizophilum TaxID=420402 RepID=UPI000371F0F4|nr:HDOD domain-containing protein [Marinobacterium rhizophilum]